MASFCHLLLHDLGGVLGSFLLPLLRFRCHVSRYVQRTFQALVCSQNVPSSGCSPICTTARGISLLSPDWTWEGRRPQQA